MFVIYELLVTVLLLNLLIAMMARTYDEIAQTQMEWKRQVSDSPVFLNFANTDFMHI